jgi:hypothetical protein
MEKPSCEEITDGFPSIGSMENVAPEYLTQRTYFPNDDYSDEETSTRITRILRISLITF